MTKVLPIQNCVRCMICCQAGVCPISPSFGYKCCGNAKAGKIAAVRSLSRNKTPHVGQISLNGQKSGGSGSQQHGWSRSFNAMDGSVCCFSYTETMLLPDKKLEIGKRVESLLQENWAEDSDKGPSARAFSSEPISSIHQGEQ